MHFAFPLLHCIGISIHAANEIIIILNLDWSKSWPSSLVVQRPHVGNMSLMACIIYKSLSQLYLVLFNVCIIKKDREAKSNIENK